MITQEWDVVLLLIATFAGWLLGRTSGKRRGKLESEPSKIESLIKWFDLHNEADIQKLLDSLEVTPDTVETHLALAGMYRKKGEYSKSLAIHQNLFGRSNIKSEIVALVQFELACDFLSLGMMGRAESLFSELIKNNSPKKYRSLEKLIQIYDLEKDWTNCVRIGEQFGRKITSSQAQGISHHYCELAIKSLGEKKYHNTEQFIKKSLSHNSKNARAWLLLAQVEATRGRYNVAFKYTLKAANKCPDFISEILPKALEYAERENCVDQYLVFLDKMLSKRTLSSLQLAKAEIIYRKSPDAITSQLIESSSATPSRKVVMQLLNWQKLNYDPAVEDNIVLTWLGGLLSGETNYQCYQCGFEPVRHSWQCPQCKQWDTIQDKEDRVQLMQENQIQI